MDKRILDEYDGKSVLVTGGTGSIGSCIVRKVLEACPYVVRVLSRDEHKQAEMRHELGDGDGRLRYLIGDVRDRGRLTRAMEGVDYVFHAAAMKHVPVCEYDPFEAVRTNIIGTQNVIEAALDCKVRKVVMISTDKAVDPVSAMGISKLMAERLMISANRYKGHKDTMFSVVRFGNVLNSRGSVVPLFRKQIEEGRPITLTDSRMTRFIMTIDDAVGLVLKAASKAVGGEVFILKMDTVNIGELAESMLERHGEAGGISLIGAREGEKLHEELMTAHEASYAYETDDMYILATKQLSWLDEKLPRIHKGIRKADKRPYASNGQEPMDMGVLMEMI